MKKKSLVQEARFLANYEYETRKKNYQNEYKNCKDFILSEAQNGKRSIEYVVNIIDIKYLDGWDIGEYIEFITKQLKKEKFKTLVIGIGRMRIEW